MCLNMTIVWHESALENASLFHTFSEPPGVTVQQALPLKGLDVRSLASGMKRFLIRTVP